MTTTTIELAETYTNESGTWGWTEDGQLHCTTCNSKQYLTCTACNGNTCDCSKPSCRTCADPATECEACDNTGRMPCPTCER